MPRPVGPPPTGGDPSEFVCEACGATFESADDLRRHLHRTGLVC